MSLMPPTCLHGDDPDLCPPCTGEWVQACDPADDPCPRGVRCDYCHA